MEEKNNIKIKNIKSGITFFTLIITIIVALILLTAITIQTKKAIDNATMVAFYEDLDKVSQEVRNYYMSNQAFPTETENEASLTTIDVMTYIDSRYLSQFNNELELNKDNTDNVFYKIDLTKLNIEKSVAGFKKNGINDMYVISYPNMNLYYLKGQKINNIVYYSVTSKLSQVVKVEEKQSTSTDEPIYYQSYLKKETNTWSNKLTITAFAKITSGDKLYLVIPKSVGYTEMELANVATGNYNKTFTIYDLLFNNKDTSGNKILVTDLPVDMANAFRNFSSDNKYIEIVKKNNSVTVDRFKISISNYDDISPTLIASNVQVTTAGDGYNININVTDDVYGSGIRELRYDYLTKVDEFNVESNYYDSVSNFDTNYMLYNSKIADKVNDTTYSFEVPKGVKKISMIAIDKAGNWTKLEGYSIY